MMGDHGRRPNRMARLRILFYVVLVLAADINVSNSMMRERRTKKTLGGVEQRERPEVHSKVGVSWPEVHSKVSGPRPEVRSKEGVSRPEVHSKEGVSRPEVHSKVRVPRPEVHSKEMMAHRRVWSKEKFSRPVVHSKELVSHLMIDSKAGDSSPKIIDKLLRLDRHSNLQEQTGHLLIIKDCPSDCICYIKSKGDQTALFVEDCGSDPIDALPNMFDSHRDITQVQIINCHLSSLPLGIVKLPLVVVLLDMNEFTEVPQELLELPHLEQLYMNNNKLSSLPADVTKLSSLKVLSLNHNMISELPEEIGGMSDLLLLNLTHNELQSLPQSIGALSQLVVLDIAHNTLKSLPAEVGNLKNLTKLTLHNNQLKTVPCEIGGMTKLLVLELQSNEIRMLPDEITELKHLLILQLSNNPLGEVPALPTERLVGVSFSNCSINTFPCELLTEGHIQMINLANNGIQTADNCGQIENNNMRLLDLSYNSLQEVPCEYALPLITEISFVHNDIATLPKMCSFLVYGVKSRIEFHRNKISVLHFSSFCRQTSRGYLTYIGFPHNRISTVDTSDSPIHQCFKASAVIHLFGNMLSVLDSWPMLLSLNKSITVDVSLNNLSTFTSSAGSFLYASKYGSIFRMQGNQIRHFMDVFNGWKVIVNTTKDLNTLLKNAYFDLGYNPLVCDCVDYEVYTYIQSLSTEQYNNLVCHEPLSLRGQNPNHIALGNFVCDIDINCPDGCNCINVPHSQTINITCLSYNEADIPEVMPDLPKLNYLYRIDISHQNLNEIIMRPYLHNTTEIRLSNNSIMAIKINSTNVLRRVKILHLDNNCLQRLPESVTGITNHTVVELRLGNNPWVCDCEAMTMKNWILRNWHFVKDKDIIYCHSPPSMVHVKVIDIDRSMVCPNENKTPVYIVAAISSAVLIFIVYIYIYDKLKYANWRWVGSDECDGEFKEFDVFLCACSAVEDAEYVENFLIPELERRDFRVLYHREHFHPGKPIHVNMSEAFEKSKRTLVFFSNSFKQSGYSMFEFHSALDLDIRNHTRRLITIKDKDLDMSKLDLSEVHYFQTYTYVDREDVKFWQLLENALPRKRLGAQIRPEGT